MDNSAHNTESAGLRQDHILDVLPTGTLITRISDGTILFANRAIGKMLGIEDVASVFGTPVPNFYGDPAERQIVVGRFRAEGSLEGYEMRARRLDGSLFWVSISLQLFEFEGEKVLLSTILDITQKKEAEQRLIDSEQRLRSLFDALPQPVIVTQISDGMVLYANQQVSSLIGLPLDQLLGKRTPDFYYDPADRLRFVQTLQKEGRVRNAEIQIKRQDGIPFWAEITIELTAYQGSPATVAIIEDISKRRAIEEEIHLAAERQQQILDVSPTGMLITRIKEGTILFANQSIGGILGIQDAATIVGEPVPDFYFDSADRKSVLEKVQKEGSLKEYELRIKRADGSMGWVLLSIRPMEFGGEMVLLSSIIDIAHRKKVEAELFQEKAFSDAVINSLPGVFYLFDPQGRMIRWNQNYELVTGYSAEEIAQSNALDPIAEEDKSRTYAAIQQVFVGGQAIVEAQMVHRSGERTPYYFAGKRMQIGDDIYITGAGYDISDRKRLESELQASLQRRGYQVQLSTEISQEIAAAPELATLFERVVTLVRERLGYYHTQLLRYDPTQDAVVLIAGYGETGAKMLAADHRMPMGRGLIGLAAQTGETILRPDLAAGDPNWQPNPLLPETKGEIAVPIKLGQQILGVLDVQSSQAGLLSEDDRLLLEGLCGQIAIAMDQTRLRQEMTERLEEINILYRTMNREGWDTFLQKTELPGGFLFDQAGTHPISADTSMGIETFASAPLAVPGGVSIGTLALSDDPGRPLTPEDHLFLQQISEQVALALESARLFTQTQSTLAQTETLYAGSERIIRAGTMNEALASVIETSALKSFERASIMLFNRNWSAQPPETGVVVGQWTRGSSASIVPMGALFPIGQLPFAAFMRRDTPVFISDVQTDARLDPQTRAMISGIGQSMAFFPLVAGDQWFGFLITAASAVVSVTPDALRQVESLVGQAATVIQSIRLYEQAQAAAQRERILREVTAQVRTSVDTDTILRTAVRELGQALGRETFVRIGGGIPSAQTDSPAREAQPTSPQPVKVEGGR